nr:uncharacterized protein LOC106038767 [Anser cygnoides]XP_047915730.1 uncharacterized protein LOC106038767 [Anser cygnoides]XP_047915731.1 uncharacterized protein LOC106038767 [Anser cygnoides]XP_047915732.1 uncharacterized protein LOC106038767 [Anser cygnoides]XP_047915733.1 uncharacterized protein LOC106038767 [Anser cygnoides]XP_047915734.1 uncharacterized protein LOC106038767 [Anser cygnoides]
MSAGNYSSCCARGDVRFPVWGAQREPWAPPALPTPELGLAARGLTKPSEDTGSRGGTQITGAGKYLRRGKTASGRGATSGPGRSTAPRAGPHSCPGKALSLQQIAPSVFKINATRHIYCTRWGAREGPAKHPWRLGAVAAACSWWWCKFGVVRASCRLKIHALPSREPQQNAGNVGKRSGCPAKQVTGGYFKCRRAYERSDALGNVCLNIRAAPKPPRAARSAVPHGAIPALLTPRTQPLPHPVTYDQEIIACAALSLAERLPYHMIHNSGVTDETTEQCVFTETLMLHRIDGLGWVRLSFGVLNACSLLHFLPLIKNSG